MSETKDIIDYRQLKADIQAWGLDLGFQQIGISDVDLADAEQRLGEWVGEGYHGTMRVPVSPAMARMMFSGLVISASWPPASKKFTTARILGAIDPSAK